ncbi:MAG TPA: alpha/beta hydrolase [Rudaea sp.]|nr:alpha/beta hydrolase [Rudaea sp.]
MMSLRISHYALAAALVAASPARAQLDLLDDTRASSVTVPAGVEVLHDLHYGSATLETLDVYRPARAANAPVFVMVHGGGWRLGDKAMGRMVDSKIARWAPRGIVFVSIDYGLLPATPVTRQVDDIAQALAYVQRHAADWGGDPKKIVLMGHSAGAHLVDVLAADPARARAAGAQPWLGTVSLDSAAIDVPAIMKRHHMRLYDAAFGGDAAQWKALSPIDLVAAPAPPMLAVCSTLRPDDSCGASHRFAARAEAAGTHVRVLEEALTHGEINFTLGNPGAYTDAVEAFLASLDPAIARLLEPRR